MNKNDKIQTIIIIFLIVVGIGLLGYFTTRLVSGNKRGNTDITDGLEKLESKLEIKSSSEARVQELTGELIVRNSDHIDYLERTEIKYNETNTEIDSRLHEIGGDTAEIINGVDGIGEYDIIDDERSSSADKRLDRITGLLQQLINMEPD